MDKSILIQKQVRDNAEELQSFMRDLTNWEQEMKRKETQICGEVPQDFPPIRKKTKVTEVRSEKESPSSANSENKLKKISGFDYKAWEKLDVDKLCRELDEDLSSAESEEEIPKIDAKTTGKKFEKNDSKSSEYCNSSELSKSSKPSQKLSSETSRKDKDSQKNWRARPEYQNQPPIREYESFKDDHWRDKPEAQVRTRANYFKELGNEFVAEENWNEAIKMYSNAINLYPLDTVFYANRALCHLRLQKYEDAQIDCDIAIKYNDKYVKAYLRRATALQHQGNYDLAKQDFQTVLKYEPTNSFAKDGLKSVKNLETSQGLKSATFQKSRKEPSCTTSKDGRDKPQTISALKDEKLEAEPIVSPVIKIWTAEKNDSRVLKGPIAKPAHLQSFKPLKSVSIKEVQSDYQSPLRTEEINRLLKKTSLSSSAQSEFPKVNINPSPSPKKIEELETNQNTSQASANALKVKEIETDPPNILEIKNEPSKIKEIKNTSLGKSSSNISNLDEVSIPRVPISYVGFTNSWNSMKDEQAKRYMYLKNISGKKLPSICGDSVENSVLSEIIDVLANEFIQRNENIYPFLLGLTSIKRFRALVLFLSDADKTALRKLIGYCQSNEECSETDIAELQKLFEV